MSIKSYRKGAAGEREVADILNAHGFPAKRNGCYEKDDVTCWYEGQDSEPSIIEVKRRKISSKELYAELVGRQEVWHRDNNQEWMVTLRARDHLANKLAAKGGL